MIVEHNSSKLITWCFYLTAFILFGCTAWKAEFWASITVIASTPKPKLATYYRWMAIVVILGLLINVLVRL